MKQINPPYDGSEPCPMCNEAVRGVSALVFNFLNRWPGARYDIGEGTSRAMVKLHDIIQFWRRPAEIAVPHPAVIELMDVADALVAACHDMHIEGIMIKWTPETVERVKELIPRALAASDAVEPLSEAHFDDERHSSGGENWLRSKKGYDRNRGNYDYHVNIVEEGGDLSHGVCDTRFEIHEHFRERLAKDPLFYGKFWCLTCRQTVPFAQLTVLRASWTGIAP